MIRVLFVCLGNICRSPMAEAVFMHRVREAGLAGRIDADSAGTGSWHLGEPAHRGTRQVLSRKGISYDGRSRLLLPEDLVRFEYVIAMDLHNLRDIRELGQTSIDFLSTKYTNDSLSTKDTKKTKDSKFGETKHAVVGTLMEYAPELGWREVPDPYYSGKFDEVFELVDAATGGLLEAIRREHGL